MRPIHKKQSKGDYKIFRPISLLWNIEKIIEKLMCKRLPNFLDINNLICLLHFNFWEKTIYALTNLTEIIRQALDEGSPSYIFLDLPKEFDTSDHEILLHKLEYYGIHGACDNWFMFYFSDNDQFVFLNCYNSHLKIINLGKPCHTTRFYWRTTSFMNFSYDPRKTIQRCKKASVCWW